MKISFTVTNDLIFDQRMNRICETLQNAGFNCVLIGRKKKQSKKLLQKNFEQVRLHCFFQKGKLFYLEYNLRLFWYLLWLKTDVFCAIDLDTMLPNYFVAKIRKKPLVYDAHEYFTEMEEVVVRPAIKKVWKFIEKNTVPAVKAAYTVSNGYKQLFEKEYNIPFEIIRNATILEPINVQENPNKSILYQGSVNVGRALEETIEAMQFVDAQLIICGKGDVEEKLKELVKQFNLQHKVLFLGYLSPTELKKQTQKATIGLTLFTNKGLSNQYSLANRFFDYLHAAVPQIAVKYPEYVDFNKSHEVAYLIQEVSVKSIADGLNVLLQNQSLYNKLKQNCVVARQTHHWQNEAVKLVALYKKLQKG